MRNLLAIFALAGVVCAFSIQDVPQHMRELLDRYIEVQRSFDGLWSTFTEDERQLYQQMLLSRMDKIPDINLIQLHEIVERMPEEYRHKFLIYLRQKFPTESSVQHFDNEVDQIGLIMGQLPIKIRDQIHSSLHIRFEEAEAYNIEVSVK